MRKLMIDGLGARWQTENDAADSRAPTVIDSPSVSLILFRVFQAVKLRVCDQNMKRTSESGKNRVVLHL